MRDPGSPANSGINAQLLAAAEASGDLVSGHKQGFCMVDSAQYSAGAGPAKFLSCSTSQGISVGWEDVYPPQLPDQFIQRTVQVLP
jgi:lysyl oxidase